MSSGVVGKYFSNIGLWLILTSAILTFQVQAATKIRILSEESALADFEQLYTLLRQDHPNLYAHTSPKKLKLIYNEERAKMKGPVKLSDLFGSVSKLLAAVCDEHTVVSLNDAVVDEQTSKFWPMYQYPLIIDGTSLLIDTNRYSNPKRVISINSYPAKKIVAYLRERISGDGCANHPTIHLGETTRNQAILLSEYLRSSSRYLVEISGEDSVDNYPMLSVYPMRLSDQTASMVGTIGEQLQSDKFELEYWDLEDTGSTSLKLSTHLSFKWSRNGDIAYLRIGDFNRSELRDNELKLALGKVIKKKPETLILDLRYNNGGFIRQAQLVAAHLMPRAHRLWDEVSVVNTDRKLPANYYLARWATKDAILETRRFFRRIGPKGRKRTASQNKTSFGLPDFKGEVLVLVGPATHSAAARLAGFLQQNRRAKIFGHLESASTRTACVAPSGFYSLKHSKLKVAIPDMCFRIRKGAKKNGGRLVPDFPTEPATQRLVDVNRQTLENAIRYARR